MDFQYQFVLNTLPQLMQGVKLTIYITVYGLVGGMILGLFTGLFLAYKIPLLNLIGAGYVWIIRGTPIVVQAMFVYFALPLAMGIRMSGINAAVLVLAINAGAYIAEIVRGAVLSINKGLVDAGLALGLSRLQVTAFVVGPLAFRRMIPPLGNQFIIGLKDTSLFIVIGVGELTRQGQEIMASSFRALEVWTAVAIIYLVLTTVLALSLRWLERRMKII
ncbi:glutamine ABC transporter permease GlnP [Desulfonatronovibrio hydrogenovorans]|uniref:glutamine ABC transporter permease GlnP n=1 Tax=Desulfonatronovibrio hydrogenovorans TaxID=53245 RepID=UPI00048E74A5|nr:glutamine ABC transporter permease GlnP [Desulfonatronovibrio hydrogenovorans]